MSTTIKIEIYRAIRTYYTALKPEKAHHVSNWYWHAKSRNGNVLADGGEGYQRKSTMLRSIKSLFGEAHLIVEVTPC